jgi:ABC-type Na+ efflux pump permease subunit
MRYVRAVFEKEAAIYKSQPVLYVNLLLLPTILILLISFAFENLFGSSARVPLPVVDLDNSTASRSLTTTLSNFQLIRVEREQPASGGFSEEDAVDRFRGGKRAAVLIIPSGYGEAIAAGSSERLVLYTDPARTGQVSQLRSAVQAAVDRESFTELSIRLASDHTFSPIARIRSDVEAGVSGFLAAPGVALRPLSSAKERGLPSPFEQTVPGFAVLFSGVLTTLLWFVTMTEKNEWGIGGRLVASAGPLWTHVAGKMLTAYLFGAAQFAILMFAAHFTFGNGAGLDRRPRAGDCGVSPDSHCTWCAACRTDK